MCLPDLARTGGLAPLGGLAAALRHAGGERLCRGPVRRGRMCPICRSIWQGFSQAKAAAIVESQPVVGLWPVEARPALQSIPERQQGVRSTPVSPTPLARGGSTSPAR